MKEIEQGDLKGDMFNDADRKKAEEDAEEEEYIF
jgi:hypothetical protein